MRAHGLLIVVAALCVAWCMACGQRAADEAAMEHKPESSPSPAKPSGDPVSTSASTEPATEISVIKTKLKGGEEAAIGIKAPAGWTVMRAPEGPDPHAGKFTLAEALKGLDKQGTLSAHIDTSAGSIYCDLFEKEAPLNVATFVGLARGKRQLWDTDKNAWLGRPYYAGTTFHRTMPGFMIQGGDHTGTGKGGTLGFTVPDEIAPNQLADKPGLLFMANRGPHTADSQFFITTGPAPHINGKFSKIGQCDPVAVVDRISRMPSAGRPTFRPNEPIVIRGIEIRRLPGGRMKWIPAGTDLSVPGAIPAGRAVQVPASAR
jgi:peptidyl-prolyl cis-trans isomerase A (cyclophilin A)